MSVQFAQQTELVRLDKRACQKSTSMQTMQSGKDEQEGMENEEPTPRASPPLSSWPGEVQRLKRELEERNAVIGMLKKELRNIQSGPEQVCVTYMLCTVIQNPLTKFLFSTFQFILSEGRLTMNHCSIGICSNTLRFCLIF